MNSEDLINSKEFKERYEDKNFIRRMKEMIAGFKCPKFSRERKLAELELQRLQAPVISIVAIVLTFISLAIITAVQTNTRKPIEITIAEPEEQTPDFEDDKEETPPDPEPIDEPVEIEIDTPQPGPITEITPVATPIKSNDVSVKPANVDSVALVDSVVKMKCMLGTRTPGQIGKATVGGVNTGDPTTEACVLKVLWWLKKNQSTDGSWKGPNTLANTALATLTYLAHGEYPGSESPYKRDFGPVVQQAIDWLMNQVNDTNPVTMKGADGNEYAFLIATYALSEAYGMTHNLNCKDVAYRCLERIVKGQSITGGWDYKLNPSSTRDDVSFAGWALQALKAGKLAGIHVEGMEECIKKAISCLKSRNYKNGGFGYTAGGNPTGLTATGCLAMQLLGYGQLNEVKNALDYMRDWTPTYEAKDLDGRSQGSAPQYYCYYATQCKYQAGMKQGATKADELAWQNWNKAMKKYYPSVIIDDPEPVKDAFGKDHKQGHFENKDAHTSRPVMDTCLAALQLMVYYRYLPSNGIVEEIEKKDTNQNKNDDGVNVVVDI